jgi:hypothetical protein
MRRNYTVPEYGMTVQEIVNAVSKLRDNLDGPTVSGVVEGW